ncbi:MAG: hypothetical protein AAF708_18080 [Deinococcota bacterium]
MSPLSKGQSLWLESGLAYRETETGSYEPLLKLGLRGFLSLSEPLSLYAALAWRDGLVADAGVWYAFDPNLQDPFGFQTYGGAGLTFVSGDSASGNEDSFGLALSVAASYAIDETFGLAITYTHRPLLLPELSQAFDVSLGITLSLDSLLGRSAESISPEVDATEADATDIDATNTDVQPLTAEPADGSTDVLDETTGADPTDNIASDIQEESTTEETSGDAKEDDAGSTPDAGQP